MWSQAHAPLLAGLLLGFAAGGAAVCDARKPAAAKGRGVRAPEDRPVSRGALLAFIAEAPRRRDARFAPTTPLERAAFAALVPALLEAARAGGAARPAALAPWRLLAALVDFRILVVEDRRERFLALVERETRLRGAGAYVFRVGPCRPSEREVFLQAPHATSDLLTGQLAAALFFDPPGPVLPRALFVSTMGRDRADPGARAEGRRSPSDVAHAPGHLFTTATRAAASASGARIVLVQLHGFADGAPAGGEGGRTGAGRAAVAAPGVRAIVSAGRAAGSTPRSAATAAALAALLGGGVLRFPEDEAARPYGGTRNAQGRALAECAPESEFVHVELSRSLRRRLAGDPAGLAQLGRALLAPPP